MSLPATTENASADRLSIQQAALVTGLSAHTLRYYERIGLLAGVGRDASGHRSYSPDDLTWIGFLNCLRATGMPVARMQEYTLLLRQGEPTADARRAILEAHRRDVQATIRELTRHLGAIDEKIRRYVDRAAADGGEPHPAPEPT